MYWKHTKVAAYIYQCVGGLIALRHLTGLFIGCDFIVKLRLTVYICYCNLANGVVVLYIVPLSVDSKLI